MAKCIMIQGTMSNVGKSLFAAALCRIFKQDGYKVAPFKSQNMALNSFITEDGFEMGRAQVMQAEAAGIKPDVCMNPILLKPTTDVGSQVIVNGEVVGNMKAREYFAKKLEFIPDIMKAYEKLDKEYDIIVIEGAGSPAELNLQKDDIVNMGLAKLLKAPVLLVGDIDRGGVFAQLIGTVNLLEEDERALIKGLIVNKFRGDATLFTDGISILEEKSGVKVAGVVPYVHVDVEDEDSLSDKFMIASRKMIDIVVIKLPKMSNYTDFDVFNQYKNVSLRYITNTSEFGNPDFIIIPGTKSTIEDCKWLRQSGIEVLIRRAVNEKVPVFGVCGGYQILGREINDPDGMESGGSIKGLNLLPTRTLFRNEKTRTRIEKSFGKCSGIFSELSDEIVEGYEIHMGETVVESLEKSNQIVYGCNVNNVYGTYVHGIFDNGKISEKIVRALYNKRGLEFDKFEVESVDRKVYKEMQYDKLADEVRKNIDLKYIYEKMLNFKLE